MPLKKHVSIAGVCWNACAAIMGLLACSALSGCLVAGHTGHGGAFVWPAGLGLVFLLMIVLWFLLRRR